MAEPTSYPRRIHERDPARLTQAKARALLCRALAALDAFAGEGWTVDGAEDAARICMDAMAAAGALTVEGVIKANTPKLTGRHGPDRQKRKSRKEADRKRVDRLSASMAGSNLSRTDQQNPGAGPNDEGTTVDQSDRLNIEGARTFQQSL